jgi:hypothetical protein
MELRLSSSQLRRAAAIQERIESLQRELDQLAGGSGRATNSSRPSSSSRGRTSRARGKGRGRNISSAGIARIAEAQRKRWAQYRKQSGKSNSPKATKLGSQRRRFSPAALARISKAQKERWANYRKEAGATA